MREYDWFIQLHVFIWTCNIRRPFVCIPLSCVRDVCTRHECNQVFNICDRGMVVPSSTGVNSEMIETITEGDVV